MTIVNYDWDEVEDNIVEEYDAAGGTIAEYTNEPSVNGHLISQRCSDLDRYFHYYGEGSTLALTNASGDVVDTFEYSSFGGRTGTSVNNFQYVGQFGYNRNGETEDYDVRRRALAARLGRWISVDPINLLSRLRQYEYAHNSPPQFVDPGGMLCIRVGDIYYESCGKILQNAAMFSIRKRSLVFLYRESRQGSKHMGAVIIRVTTLLQTSVTNGTIEILRVGLKRKCTGSSLMPEDKKRGVIRR